jgi:hypothetical protein
LCGEKVDRVSSQKQKKNVFFGQNYIKRQSERLLWFYQKKKYTRETSLFIFVIDIKIIVNNNGANNAISAAKTKRAQREHRSHVARGVFAPGKVGIYRRVFAKRLSRVEDTFIARQSDSKVR